jgi:2-hydroxy-5-methyl-1-naphthoate 7-hydroxylase
MGSPAGNAPFVIDPTGRDIFGEAERIRALGPVACVEMPGGVRAWAASDQGLPRRLLADWPLFAWVARRSARQCRVSVR